MEPARAGALGPLFSKPEKFTELRPALGVEQIVSPSGSVPTKTSRGERL